ncbi:peptidase inhibitor family I36 protein [Kribbella sp. NPDC051587]|uniref:peptidase inhibitor family I36 protein n=1 Tax=Kribbella sp. NPDC051587 TaxID=3364119 RepID=UPI00379283B0
MKFARALAVTAAIGSVAAMSTIPAHAATGYNRCPAGRFCAFTGPNGTGVIAIYTKSDRNLADRVGPRGMNNNIESAWNRYKWEFGLMNDANFAGKGVIYKSGAKGNVPKNLVNKASSVWFVRADQ